MILKRLDEFLHVLEGSVNRSEANVGDIVESAQLAHEFLPDQRRGELFFPARERPVADAFDDRFQLSEADGAFLAGRLQPLQHFFLRERLATPVFFDHEGIAHRQHLDRREARLAFQAFAPTANNFAFLLFAGVEHPVFTMSARRAFHDECRAPSLHGREA